MKKIVTILCALALVSCAGMGIHISDNATSVLQDSAISTVGYLIVKNNPKFKQPIQDWYVTFQGASTLPTIQSMFKEGLNKLASSVSDDPYLTMQIQNAMQLLEINADGPQVEADIEKYQGYVRAFMMGVLAAPYKL